MIRKPIVHISAVKAYLPFQSGYDKEDAKLSALVDLATQQIEEFTRRSFTKQTHTEYFSTKQSYVYEYALWGDSESGVVQSSRDQIYPLRGWPLGATGFTISYDPKSEFGSDTVVAAGYYKIDLERSRFILRYPSIQGYQTLKVTYEAGYEAANGTLQENAPADLKQACVLQTMYLWNRSQPVNVGVADDRAQGSTATSQFRSAHGLSPEAASLVAKYRIIGKGAN